MTHTWIEPVAGAQVPHGERGRMEIGNRKLASLALAAAMALLAGACEGGDLGGGTRPDEAAHANESPTMVPETAARFLDPLTGDQAVRDLFEVEAPNAEYWRLLTLDRYDGQTWTSSDPEGSQGGLTVSSPATLPQDPASTYPADTGSMTQTFRILSDLDVVHALPMAATAEEIAGPIGEITWDPYLGQAFVQGGLEAGMEYTVNSRIVVPTPKELDRVEFAAPHAYGAFTELPADLDSRFGAIAEAWTADATSDYGRVLAIQQHFQGGGFVYSTDVGIADDADGLLEFLTRTRTGFCQHYTAAMVVLVRSLGLPARIAVGFRTGTQQRDGSYLVRTTDAHVWVEVLFPRYGWLPFEPEAGSTYPNAQVGTYLNP